MINCIFVLYRVTGGPMYKLKQTFNRELLGNKNKSASRCIPHTAGSPLSAEFRRHCVLSGRTQRRALPRHQSEVHEYFISSSGGSNPQPAGFTVTPRTFNKDLFGNIARNRYNKYISLLIG